MSENQLPVLTLDFDDDKIRKLEEISEKFKAAFSVGPGGFAVPQAVPAPSVPDQPSVPSVRSGADGDTRKKGGKSGFDEFLKNLNKDARATLKTFGLVNKTLKTTITALKNLFTTTVSWGASIAAISGGGFLGYGFMAHRATEQYKSAQGLGVSTGEMQAAHNVYGSRFSNTGNMLQALAAAQENPGSPGYGGLLSLGINPQDGAAANLPKLLAGVSTLLKQYKGTGVSQSVLRSYGLDGIIDVGTANQVLANSDRLPELNKQFTAQSQRLDQGLGAGTQQSYQDLTARFTYNADRIGNAFLKALSRLNGPIGRVSDELTASIEKFLNGRNGKALFDTLARGLERLADWLGSDKFRKDLDDFSKAVGRIARAIGSAIDWLAGYGIKVPESVDEARKNSSFNVSRSPEELRRRGMTEQQASKENSGFTGFVRALGNTSLGLLTGGRVTVDSIEERAASGGWANFKKEKLPRGLRNNNPGNLNFAGQPGATLEDGPGARFARFPTMLEGVAALDKQVGLYLKRGKNTISEIVDTYAPASDNNDTLAYKQHLSRYTGLGVNDQIDATNNTQIKNLIMGIIRHENGSASGIVSSDDVLKAMALNRNSQKIAAAAPLQQTVKVQIEQKPGSDILAQVAGQYVPR